MKSLRFVDAREEAAAIRADDRLRARVRSIPARFERALDPWVTIRLIDGQTVYSSGGTTKYGVNRSGSVISSVGTAYDPNGVGATPGLFTAVTGIGRGEVLTKSGWSTTLVLVLLDPNSEVDQAVMQGEQMRSNQQMTIPGPGGTFIHPYLIHWF